MEGDIKREIRKVALQNAFEHGGKTNDRVVLSKILGAVPEFRDKVREISAEVTPIVDEVNGLSPGEQRDELERDHPELLRKERSRQGGPQLPELDGAQEGKVVTRFPPEPNGYPHIGHAKAAIINSEYADMYGGKKILRFDDTNPEAERKEFYAAIKVGLDWLGIEYDVIKNTSDDIRMIYQKGLHMIETGSAYVCTCKRDDISKNRREMRACKCSAMDQGRTLERWHKMFEKFKPGEAVARFRGDMGSENTAMRDPVLFRIIEGAHPKVGEEYRVWPSYDLAVAIEDSVDGVTHAFRSKEYELRDELYYSILDALGMRKPRLLEFSRLAFKGMPVSKRVLRQLIEERKVSWYDDPRLPTLEALRKRGIRPEAVRKFILSLGFTKSDTLAPFDSLEAFNRKIIDAESIRLGMVREPKRLAITGLPSRSVEVQNHPSGDMGRRRIEIGDSVYISSGDCSGIQAGDRIRLMGLGNVRIARISAGLEGEYTDDETGAGHPKIQWVPHDTAHRIRILIPKPLFIGDQYNEGSLEEIDALTEPHYLELRDGDPIQFIRFGYCRKDSRGQAIYTHR